jgi:membrane fusion protein (multidrug efflux system)
MGQLRRGLFALGAGVLLAACGPGGDGGEVEFRVPVTVREVELGAVEDVIVATGNLRAPELAKLVVESPGKLSLSRIGTRRLAEGDRVSAGQVLARVIGEDARLAARSDATRQRFEAAEAELESRRQLFDDGLISREELRNAETALEEARLEWDRSRLTEERNRLVTPISGVVLKLARDASGQPVAEGQLVSAGFEVAEIGPISSLIADVDLVGTDVGRVRTGQEARIRHGAFQRTTFPGEVVRLAPSVDPTTRSFRVEVEIDNAEEQLRPGMFVEVTILVERREGVTVVPRDAVTERGGERVLFVLDGQRVSRRPVSLGLGDDEQVEVTDGIAAGERVVVRGLETLTDGTRVRVSGD